MREIGTHSKWILAGGLGLMGLAVLAYWTSKPDLGPPPASIADDALLVEGRSVYLRRCSSCHGERGRGDGPLSKGLLGPKPRNFAEDEWKHGDGPGQVLDVIADGIKETSMAGWKNVYSHPEMCAVASYIYFLAGKPIPKALRSE